MAQLISVKLSRFDGSPWGFRLQGGKDFGTPLIVQKVNGGSPAEQAGLRAGDAVIRVNNTDMFNLRHKDAQDVIVRSGNSFEMTVQRGGSTWRPNVSPVSASLPSPQPSAPASCVSPVTKTSLAAKKQDAPLIGSGHNFTPKPFLNGGSEGPIKSIVNKQYNSPVGIYSEETIAETLSAQAEVLAGGVLGVNFKKNERNYNAGNSEVFKMVQEADKEPKSPEPVTSRTEFYSSMSHAVGGRATSPRSPTPLGRNLGQSQPFANSYESPGVTTNERQLPIDHQRRDDDTYNQRPITQPPSSFDSRTADITFCNNCDNPIVGVFVRIKDKNLHVECFKCSTCGTSLKNVGYYNINNKLYCDIHAKLVARQQAPSGLTPITVPPGGKAPAGTISAALSNLGGSGSLSPSLNSHGSPQPFSARLDRRSSGDLGSPPRRLSRVEQPIYCETTRTVTNNDARTIYDESDSYSKEDVCNAKTYTSTITFRTGNEVGRLADTTSDIQLDDNRNPTNKSLHELDKNLSLIDDTDFPKKSFVVSSSLYSAKSDENSSLNDDTNFPRKSFIVSSSLHSPKSDENSTMNGDTDFPEKSFIVSSSLCPPKWPIIGSENEMNDLERSVNQLTIGKGNGAKIDTADEKQNEINFCDNHEAPVVNTFGVPRYHVTNHRLKLGTFSAYNRSPEKSFSIIETPLPYNKGKSTSGEELRSKEAIEISNAILNHRYRSISQRLGDKEAEKIETNGKFVRSASLRLQNGNGKYQNGGSDEKIGSNRKIPGYQFIGTNGRHLPIVHGFKNSTNGSESSSVRNKPPTTVLTSTAQPFSPHNTKLSHTSNNISGPKPFGGSSIIAPSNYSSPPIQNSGSNTLPRPQTQTVTANGENTNSLKNGEALKAICCTCHKEITRGPFITALGQIWCPEHFVCVNSQCRRALQDIGFVEEKGQLYCEYCFERFIAPGCDKCNNKIKGDCLNAVGKHFHPECFNCSYCGKLFGNKPFFLEDGLPYCEADWNELFTTKCYACGFPVEAGDRWVEALNNNYHSQCFNCTMCKKNLEGQSFYAKGGRPFCKNHAR